MTIIAALLVCLAVKVTFAAESECPHSVSCPCGSKGENVTVCVPSAANEKICTKLSKCETCEDGFSFCLKCPEGFEGLYCSQEISKSRPKRQWVRGRQPSFQHPFQRSPQISSRCPSLDSPKLGSIRCVSSEQQQTCIGKCLPGYNFNDPQYGDEIILTCSGGVWTPRRFFPACKSGGYCDLVVQGAGSFNCTTGMDGTRCDVHCYNRYMGRFFCYPGRSWEPTLPLCVRPKEVEEGRRCDNSGKCVCPSGRTGALCETILPEKTTCRDPGFITNGFRRNTDGSDSLSRQDFEEGQSVVYGCSSDEFALRGSSLLKCKQDGTWSSPLPKCIRPATVAQVTMCPDPGQVANADRLNSDGSPSVDAQQYRVGQSVVYTCHPGFALQRRSLITCLASGAWSFRTPYCTRITPPAPVIVTTTTARPHKVRFCRDPEVDTNGSRQPRTPPNRQGFPQGSRLEFSCNQGYDLSGERKLFCLTSGAWSASRPRCELQARNSEPDIAYCENPGIISNGQVVYYPVINSRRRPTPSSTELDELEYPEGSRLQYSCNSEYTLVGRPTLICEKSGFWSADSPTCKRDAIRLRYCKYPGDIANGRALHIPALSERRLASNHDDDRRKEYPEGSSLQYSCEEGYILEGPTSLMCDSTGTWLPARPPTCVEDADVLYCDNPGRIQNGKMRYFQPNFQPIRYPNGRLDYELNEYEVGSMLQYFCDDGFQLQGSDTQTCESTGFWSADQPACVRDTSQLSYCKFPGDLLNGRVVHIPTLSSRRRPSNRDDEEIQEEYPEGSHLQYSCTEGYTLVGPPSITCERNGRWSPALRSTCVNAGVNTDLNCDNPGRVLNGRVWYISPEVRRRNGLGVLLTKEMNEYPQDSVLEYSCDKGFRLQGSDSLTCQPTGFWSAERPTCVGDCGQSFVQTSVRIRDGQETISGEWPWVVSISVQEENSSRFICGGAVFNTRTVVTAAHCLEEGRTYILRFGKHHFRIEDDDSEVLVRTSTRIVVHPDYSDKTLDSDIGLILFQPRIEYSLRVQPICLPTIETTFRNIMTGRMGYVSGWGDTEKELPADSLLFAGLPVLSIQDCLEAYRKQSMNVSINGNMFCAGYANGTYSVCGGDSGSPFVFYDNVSKRYTLEGLVSFVVRSREDAQACGLPGRFAIFTKVFRFVPWMYQNMD